MDKKEKEKLLKQIKAASKDKDVLEAVKLENTMEERFKMIENLALETGLQKGIEQGIEQDRVNIVKAMLKEKTDYEFISKITGKTVEEIKKIEKSL